MRVIIMNNKVHLFSMYSAVDLQTNERMKENVNTGVFVWQTMMQQRCIFVFEFDLQTRREKQ